MTVEYYIQSPSQYSHEQSNLVRLAQQMQRTLGRSEAFYVLAVNVNFWEAQADALILAPHAITLIELKACHAPVYGREQGPWRIMKDQALLHGGNAANPYQQISATRKKLIKYLDRNRQRFVLASRAQSTKGQWGHVSAALVFTPYLHPDSDIVIPSTAHTWLGLIGLNEATEFIFTRVSPKINLRPKELRTLVGDVLGCQPWHDLEPHLNQSSASGHLWLLDENGRRTYAFPVQNTTTTIGRSRENTLVIPRRFTHTSRQHAYLHVENHQLLIYDQRSTHGTFVNASAVRSGQGVPLHDGDTITLGPPDNPIVCRLRYEQRFRAPDATADTQF